MSARDVVGGGWIINIKFHAIHPRSVNTLVEEGEKSSNQQESSSVGRKCQSETSFWLRYFSLHQRDGPTDRNCHPRRHISSSTTDCASLQGKVSPCQNGVFPSESNN